jgi:hypothetical protein
MPNQATRRLKKHYKAKGFKKVYTLNNLANYPKAINRALISERRALGIPNQGETRAPELPKALSAENKQRFEASLLQSLELNTANNFPQTLFANNANRSRSETLASDPQSFSRSSSPARGGTRKRRGCRFLRSH